MQDPWPEPAPQHSESRGTWPPRDAQALTCAPRSHGSRLQLGAQGHDANEQNAGDLHGCSCECWMTNADQQGFISARGWGGAATHITLMYRNSCCVSWCARGRDSPTMCYCLRNHLPWPQPQQPGCRQGGDIGTQQHPPRWKGRCSHHDPHGHGEPRGRGWSSLAWERGNRGDRRMLVHPMWPKGCRWDFLPWLQELRALQEACRQGAEGRWSHHQTLGVNMSDLKYCPGVTSD